MPVPYPPPDKLPVGMCEIPQCPYRCRAQRAGMRVCKQHADRYDTHRTFRVALNLDAVEVKYTSSGYPLHTV